MGNLKDLYVYRQTKPGIVSKKQIWKRNSRHSLTYQNNLIPACSQDGVSATQLEHIFPIVTNLRTPCLAVQSQPFNRSSSISAVQSESEILEGLNIFVVCIFSVFRFAYKLFCFASKQNKLNKTFFSLFCFAHFRFRLASFRFEAK